MKEIVLAEITSKEKVQRLYHEYREEILEGNIPPLQAAATLKAIEEFVDALRNDILIKDAIREELDKYAEKTVRFNGVTFTKKEVGVSYDFSACFDLKYDQTVREIERLTEQRKEREKLLKALPVSGMTEVDQETGEVRQIYPPIKRSTDGYSITLNSEKK